MKAEIKDKDGIICIALRAVGFNIDTVQTERLLNIAKHIENAKHEVTLKEVIALDLQVVSLFDK